MDELSALRAYAHEQEITPMELAPLVRESAYDETPATASLVERDADAYVTTTLLTPRGVDAQLGWLVERVAASEIRNRLSEVLLARAASPPSAS